MRPLGRMIQELHDELVFNPDLRKYTDSLVRRLQNKYAKLGESRLYDFFIRTDTLSVYAPVTGLVGVRELGSVAGNLRAVQGTVPGWVQDGWAGNGTWIHEDGTEYGIVRVDVANDIIYLDTPLASALVGPATTDWSIKFWSYLLPTDTVQVLGYRDDLAADGRGKLTAIGRLTEERAFLDRDNTGHPGWAIEDDSRQRRPPFEAPTLTAGAGGSLQTRKFAYRYTILGAGLESSPSPSAEITLGAGGNEVTLSDFEDIRWLTTHETGLLIRVYRRDVTKRGRWMAVTTLTGTQAAAGYTDQNMLPVYASTYDDVTYDNPEGTRQSARLYYTADADRTLSLRLWFRPRPLQSKADAPLGPSAVSDYLVNSVLSDLSKGDDRKTYYARSMEALDNLKANLSKYDERYRMSSWKEDQLASRFVSPRDRVLGTPSIS